MSLDFKQVTASETYDRWIEGNGNDSYIICRYHWSTKGHPPQHYVHPHFNAYYLSMLFPGSEDLRTYEEAVAACEKHFHQRMEGLT